jgi:uncharacterized protein YkwD
MKTPAPRLAVGAGLLAVSLIFSAPAFASTAAPTTSTTTQEAVTRAANSGQRDSILRLYKAYFLRNPDASGHTHWAEQYASGSMSLASISQFFSQSNEFRQRYGSLSNADFTGLIYTNVLGRQPDAAGRSYWVQRLDQGSSRGAMMIGFSESGEFQKKTGTRPPSPPVSWEASILAQTNAHRAAYGLHGLTACRPLAQAAQGHSNWQAQNRVMAHNGVNGSSHADRISWAGYRWSWAGENVAFGDASYSTTQIVQAWMDSPAHRDNILNPNYVHVGFGRSVGPDGLVYWTQNLGSGGGC